MLRKLRFHRVEQFSDELLKIGLRFHKVVRLRFERRVSLADKRILLNRVYVYVAKRFYFLFQLIRLHMLRRCGNISSVWQHVLIRHLIVIEYTLLHRRQFKLRFIHAHFSTMLSFQKIINLRLRRRAPLTKLAYMRLYERLLVAQPLYFIRKVVRLLSLLIYKSIGSQKHIAELPFKRPEPAYLCFGFRHPFPHSYSLALCALFLCRCRCAFAFKRHCVKLHRSNALVQLILFGTLRVKLALSFRYVFFCRDVSALNVARDRLAFRHFILYVRNAVNNARAFLQKLLARCLRLFDIFLYYVKLFVS